MVEAVAKPDELHVGRRQQQHRRLPSWASALRRRERQPVLLVPPHGPRPHPGRRRAQERQQPARGGREIHGEGSGALLPAVARGGGHGRGGGTAASTDSSFSQLPSGVGFVVSRWTDAYWCSGRQSGWRSKGDAQPATGRTTAARPAHEPSIRERGRPATAVNVWSWRRVIDATSFRCVGPMIWVRHAGTGSGCHLFCDLPPASRMVPVVPSTVHQTGGNRSDLTGYRLPVKPVRPGSGLNRYQIGTNSKFKFKFKKIKNSQKIL